MRSLFSWFTRGKRPEPAVVGVGKVPAVADFVRTGARGGAGGDLETWLARSMEWATAHRAERWRDVFDDAAPLRFVLRGANSAEAVVAGVLRPSRDHVGRRFPIAIAAVIPVDRVAVAPHLLPAIVSSFLGEAEAALPRAADCASSKEFEECIARLRVPTFDDVDGAVKRYEAWTSEQTLDGVLAELQDGTKTDGVARVLHTVLEAASPFRGKEAPPTTLSLRFPLASPTGHLTSFWLDVVRRAAAWKETIPGYVAGADSVLVQLGQQTPANAMAEVWDRDAESELVCEPTTTTQEDAARFTVELPTALREAIDDPKTSIADLLRSLAE